MSLFAENSWEADAVGDKLSQQFFHTKKNDRKNKKKNKLAPGSTVPLSKNDKPRKNNQPGNNNDAAARHAKLKSKKKKLPSNSDGNEGSKPLGLKTIKPGKNIHSTENGTKPNNQRKFETKKRKRSLSNSVEPDESSPKKSRVKPCQNANSLKSGPTKLMKSNKNLKKGSKEGLDVSNKKIFLSKKNKAVISKKTNRNADAGTEKSGVSASATGEQAANQETKSQRRRKKNKLKKIAEAMKVNGLQPEGDGTPKHRGKSTVGNLNIEKLEKMLTLKGTKINGKSKIEKEPESLRDRMMSQLRASRFRFLNETLYSNVSSESKQYFKEDPEAFTAYHSGYRQQVEQWPLNPLDVIIASVEKMPKDYIIADFGCGEARLADSASQKVHSFDFVAVNDKVKACDMAHTPLLTNGVNVVVFCLSLMGTNLADYLLEANRVLKTDGILKIADVESRFENVDEFISLLGKYGFVNTWKDLSHNLFYFMDFKKISEVSRKNKNLPEITLKPCLYKKR